MKSFREIVMKSTARHSNSLDALIAYTFLDLATELDERFPVTKKPQEELNDSKRVDWENMGE